MLETSTTVPLPGGEDPGAPEAQATEVSERMAGPVPALSAQRGSAATAGREAALDFGFFVLLTVVLTAPAVFHLGDRVLGSYPGDNFHYLWQLWWHAHAIFNLRTSPFFDPDIFFPYGMDIIRNEDLLPGIVLPAIPLTYLLGEVVTYNLLVLITFPLTAFGSYLLARQLWGSRSGALLAGLVIGFCAYRFSRAEGHLGPVSTQWIPFFFLFLERTIRQPGWRSGALTGLFYALCALATWTYAVLVPLAAMLYLSVRLAYTRGWDQLRPLGHPALLAAGIAGVLVGPWALVYAQASTSGELVARELEQAQSFAAAVVDFVIPSVRHPIWGSWVVEHWRSGPNGRWVLEWQVFVGPTALALAAIGAWAHRTRPVAALLALTAGAFVLALGPSLHLTHPPSLPEFDHLAPLSGVPLPGNVLAQVPPFSFHRGWSRMGFFVIFAIGLLAALGLAVLRRRFEVRFGLQGRRVGLVVTAAALGLAVLENLTIPFGMAPVEPRAVDRWLAAQREQFAVMEYPIVDHGFSGPAAYSRRLTGKSIILGSGGNPPNLWAWQSLSLFPSAEALDLLERWGVKYVLIDEPRYRAGSQFLGLRQTWASLDAAVRSSRRLAEVAVLDGVHVYALKKEHDSLSLGAELLGNPGFEETEGSRLVGWEAVGAPTLSTTGAQAHRGSSAIVATPSDYLVSGPTPVEADRCYRFRVFDRSDQPYSALRLQIGWLEPTGQELDSSTAAIHVVQSSPRWQEAKTHVRAPRGSSAARIYAVAEEGRVWLDEYSFRLSDDGCEATLMALPNPAPLYGDQVKTTVVWNTGDASTGHVYMAEDGGVEVPLASGVRTWETVGPLRPGASYEFRLYAASDSTVPLVTTTVTTEAATIGITADPNPVPTRAGVGRTTIAWDTGTPSMAQVYVSVNGGPEILFAGGARGSQAAPWIQAGSTYEFRLYEGTNRAKLLASVNVNGQ